VTRRHWITFITGLVLVTVSVWQIAAAGWGLQITTQRGMDPPLVVVQPRDASASERPLVLVAHGLAGSTVIMRGFAFTLAHAGYSTVSWDFDGHGANSRAAATSQGRDSLLANAEAALAEASALGIGNPDRVAILGHSMGSGAALAYGQVHPGTAATIAVSPVGQPVTLDLPHNLLLMAGALEAPFLRNAEERLIEAGGSGGDPAAGTARKLVVVPGVEHVSILFSPLAHAAARDWLDATFGSQPDARDYADRRVWWYGLGLVGALLVGAGMAPLAADQSDDPRPVRPVWRRLASLITGAVGATLALWLVSRSGLDLQSLLGMNVGGYLMIWFGVSGALSLMMLRCLAGIPSRQSALGGLLVFAVLWLGVGLLGQFVWLPWLLIPRRLLLWPLAVILAMPWFLAASETVRGTRAGGRVAWWLAHSAVVVGALFLAVQLSPELSFLLLLLPLFPAILGLHALAAAPHRGNWPFAIGGALFIGWLLLAVFPLV
jgi:dienelactone hydrolase